MELLEQQQPVDIPSQCAATIKSASTFADHRPELWRKVSGSQGNALAIKTKGRASAFDSSSGIAGGLPACAVQGCAPFKA